MAVSSAMALTDCFADLPDPRVERTRLHALTDIPDRYSGHRYLRRPLRGRRLERHR